MKKEEIAVFICENDDVAREIVGKYLKNGAVTYAEFMDKDLRPKVVEALKEIQ